MNLKGLQTANVPGATTSVAVPQNEITRSAVAIGIVTGVVVSLILFLILQQFGRRMHIATWIKLLLVAIIAWIVNILVFRRMFPVIAGIFDNTTAVFEATGVVSAVAFYAILSNWSEGGAAGARYKHKIQERRYQEIVPSEEEYVEYDEDERCD